MNTTSTSATTSRQRWNNLFDLVNLKRGGSLAFSNPIYDHLEHLPSVQEEEEEEGLVQDSSISNNNNSLDSERKPKIVPEVAVVVKPIPKPRKCRTRPQLSLANQQLPQRRQPTDRIAPKLPPEVTPPPPPPPPPPRQQTSPIHNDRNSNNLLTTLNRKTSDSIRVTRLLEEIDSLANLFDHKIELLNCSDKAKHSEKNKVTMVNKTVNNDDKNEDDNSEDSDQQQQQPAQQARIGPFRRKRIPVDSKLLKFSLSNCSAVANTISNDDEDGNDDKTASGDSADSGVFNLETAISNMITNQAQQSKEESEKTSENNEISGQSPLPILKRHSKLAQDSATKIPPKLPPRKPSKFDLFQSTSNSQDQTSNKPTSSNTNNLTSSNANCKLELLSMDHLHLKNLSLQRSGYLWKTGPNYRSFKSRWSILYRHNFDLADANFSYYFNRSGMSASLTGKIMLADIEFVATIETIPSKTRLPKLTTDSSTDSLSSLSSPNSSTNTDYTNSSLSSNGFSYFKIGVRGRQGRVYLMAARSSIDLQLWLHAFVQTISLHTFKNKELYHFGYIRVRFTITGKWQTCFAMLTTDRLLYIFEMLANDQEQNGRMIDCKSYHVFNLRKTVQINKFNDCSNNPYKSGCASGVAAADGLTGFSLTQNGGRVVYIVSNFESHINIWYQSIVKFWQIPDQPEKSILCEQYLTKEDVPVAIDRCLKFLDTFNQKMDLFSESEYGQSATPLDLNGLAHCSELLSELRVNAWNVHLLPQKHNSAQVGLLLLHYLRSMNECILTEQLLSEWLQVSDDTNFEQRRNNLKRLLKTLPPVNYATLRKIIIYLANLTTQYSLSSSLCKSMLFSRQKCTLTISISSARKLLTTLIKDYLWLFEVTKEEVDKEMHIKRMTHMIINQNAEDDAVCKSIARQSSSMAQSIICEGIGRNRSCSMASHASTASSPSIVETQNVSILIIGIKVLHHNQTKIVNVHLNMETTADQVLEMVLEKISPDNADTKLYSLFEVLCYRRLERVIIGKEKVLPIVLSWSSWPSHWSAEAGLEVKLSDYLLKICLNSIERGGGSGNDIPAKNDSINFQPMLMSVIRYCGQSDTRLTKKILVEFSCSSLFLYCKESHVLIGKYNINDIYWYVGVESGTIVHSKHPITPVDELMSPPKLASASNGMGQTQVKRATAEPAEPSGIPALTFVEKCSIDIRQGKERLNFGQTLVFSNWNEMYQWIRALLVEANR